MSGKEPTNTHTDDDINISYPDMNYSSFCETMSRPFHSSQGFPAYQPQAFVPLLPTPAPIPLSPITPAPIPLSPPSAPAPLPPPPAPITQQHPETQPASSSLTALPSQTCTSALLPPPTIPSPHTSAKCLPLRMKESRQNSLHPLLTENISLQPVKYYFATLNFTFWREHYGQMHFHRFQYVPVPRYS